MRVLLVEDDGRVAETVSAGLRKSGHDVVIAGSVASASDALVDHHFDIAVVDLGLPDGSGLDWCRSTRGSGHDFPIMVLTAQNTLSDRVVGLDSGADDYLGKPFAMDELLARLRALGRRGPRWSESTRRFGELEIDRDRRLVTVGGVRVPLTTRELEIVSLLAWRDGRVVPRDEIVESIWGEISESAGASFEVLLGRIRRKLAGHGQRGAIRTVRQVGYAWGLERSKRD
jgi:two-component system, OmpR family, response regulator